MATGKSGDMEWTGTQQSLASGVTLKYSIKLHWVETYDRATNSSTVTFTLFLRSDHTNYGTQYFDGVIKANNVEIFRGNMSSGNIACSSNSGVYAQCTSDGTAISVTKTFVHGSDGKLNLSVSFAKREYDNISLAINTGGTFIYYNGLGASRSFTAALTDIANGIARIFNGSSWGQYYCYIHNGSSWGQYIPYIFNGTSWEAYYG